MPRSARARVGSSGCRRWSDRQDAEERVDVNTINCYEGTEWNTTLCPDPETCAKACSVEGADYSRTYGVTSEGNALKLNFTEKLASSPLDEVFKARLEAGVFSARK